MEGLGVAVFEILGVIDNDGVLVGVILNVGVMVTEIDGVWLTVGVTVGEGVRDGKTVQSLPCVTEPLNITVPAFAQT